MGNLSINPRPVNLGMGKNSIEATNANESDQPGTVKLEEQFSKVRTGSGKCEFNGKFSELSGSGPAAKLQAPFILKGSGSQDTYVISIQRELQDILCKGNSLIDEFNLMGEADPERIPDLFKSFISEGSGAKIVKLLGKNLASNSEKNVGETVDNNSFSSQASIEEFFLGTRTEPKKGAFKNLADRDDLRRLVLEQISDIFGHPPVMDL